MFCFVDDAIECLKNIYNVDDEVEFCESICIFIEEIVEKNILIQEHKQIEILNSLEKEISQHYSNNEQLYSATIELTYKCNEKCRHCYVVDEKREEMTTEKIKGILDELSDLNVLNVVFTGGELFTRKDYLIGNMDGFVSAFLTINLMYYIVIARRYS